MNADDSNPARLPTRSAKTRTPDSAPPPTVSRSPEPVRIEAPIPLENGEPEVNYSAQFLTYAYTVPFRVLALQQELMDIFGFIGTFDADFVERWQALSPPEQSAFSQSYREYRRMQALGRNFAIADKDCGEEASIDDRAGRFIAAHVEGLEQWEELLQREAADASAHRVDLSGHASGSVAGLPVPLSSARAAAAVSAPLSPAQHGEGGAGRALLSSLGENDRTDVSSILDSLAPIDELATVVLEALCAHEIADAQARFLARVRWMLHLPTQQRMAVALRSIGRKRREIAKAMGISEESVKTHLARADDDWASLPDAQKRGAPPTTAARRRRAG